MKGRPVINKELKKLAGTLRKDRDRKNIEFEKIKEIPKPEPWLDSRAKKLFRHYAKLLTEKGLLTIANQPLVNIMAQELSTYEEATRHLKKEGKIISTPSGYKQQSPWISIRNQSFKNFREIAALFGIDPISTQKVVTKEEKEEDEFEKMMKKYA